MTREFSNKVYDVLVALGGAVESERETFLYHHSGSCYTVTEWRFQGKFGFGGKYRSERNEIDYYPEDLTKDREELRTKINTELSKIRE